MQSFHLFTTIVYSLPPQVVHARSSLLLHIILSCIKTPYTRVKRLLSKNQVHVSRVGEKRTQTRLLTSDISHLQHYFTLSTIFNLEHCANTVVSLKIQQSIMCSLVLPLIQFTLSIHSQLELHVYLNLYKLRLCANKFSYV